MTFEATYSAEGGVAPGDMGLGVSVTHSVAIGEDWSVPQGQKGRLLVYCNAIEHLGVWKDCDGRDVPGSWLEPLDECALREINMG